MMLRESIGDYLRRDGEMKNNLLVHIIPVEFGTRRSIENAKNSKVKSVSGVGGCDFVFAVEFENGSVVYVMMDRDLGNKEGLDFATHKKDVHDIFKPDHKRSEQPSKEMTNTYMAFNAIVRDVTKRCEEAYPWRRSNGEPDDWRDVTRNPYVFSLYFTSRALRGQEKSYYLDPNLVFYTREEYNTVRDRARVFDIEFDSMPFREDVELRSRYCSWFSWSLVLVNGDYTNDICMEYIEMEVKLQMKWNAAYRYYKSLEANDLQTRLRNIWKNRSLERVDDFEMKLNSLEDIDDAGTSDRVINLREKLIESSKIRVLIKQSRAKLEKRRDGAALFLSSLAVLASVFSVAVTLFFHFYM